MSETYRQLATLTFRHEHHHTSIAETIELNLDRATQDVLGNHGIVVKPFPGGLYLYGNDLEQFVSEKPTGALRFNFNIGDPYFYNYTDLESVDPTTWFQFTNTNEPVPNADGALLLHSGPYVSDLAKGPRDETMFSEYFGQVTLFLDALWEVFDGSTVIQYAIQFKVRHTNWRYFIIPPTIQDTVYSDFRIIDEEGVQGFDLDDADPKKLVFTSKETHPLLERPKNNFKLAFNQTFGGQVQESFISLPGPNAERLSPSDANNGDFYSDVFVYV